MGKIAQTEKTLSIPMLVGLVVVYLAIIQGMTLFLTSGQEYEYAKFPTTGSIILGVTIPVGLSVVFAAIVVTWLGWWNRIWYERIRLARWAWVFPVLMVLSIFVVINYPRLGEVGSVMVLTLLGSSLLVGIGEELMFRGITLETMRRAGSTTELKAALWTALIFGGVHATNVFTEGSGAFLQAAVVSVSGLFFYVALRVSGTLLVPIVLHAAWDFSLFSGDLGIDPEPYDFVIVAILTDIVLAIILIVRWRKIWPPDTAKE